MYLCSTPKLFDVCAKMMARIEDQLPCLHKHLFEYQIYLEVLLASPLMTLFSNIASHTEATHILTLFMLEGEPFMEDLIFNIYKNMAP
jgi:hypothetical protein